jgi:hypothetical protein
MYQHFNTAMPEAHIHEFDQRKIDLTFTNYLPVIKSSKIRVKQRLSLPDQGDPEEDDG